MLFSSLVNQCAMMNKLSMLCYVVFQSSKSMCNDEQTVNVLLLFSSLVNQCAMMNKLSMLCYVVFQSSKSMCNDEQTVNVVLCCFPV